MTLELLAAASLLLSSIFILIFHSNTYSNREGKNLSHLHPLDRSHHGRWIVRKVVGVGSLVAPREHYRSLASEDRSNRYFIIFQASVASQS